MALEKIGVEATIEGLGSFKRGVSQMDSSVEGFGRTTEGVSVKTVALGNILADVAVGAMKAFANAAVGAGKAVGGFVAEGIKDAANMEAQLSGIAAVMGTTRDEIKPLSDLIIDLGLDPRLKVTAEEAADAIELLARNGLTMSEIMEGAAFNTVLLANSTGTDFGNAANIATDAMAIFNVEAAQMEGAVDGIVSVTTNSKFTIDDYSLALRNGAAAAADMGVSIDDFNVAIAASAEEMGSGMRAGTGFRNFLQRLTPNTDKASDSMRALGLITEDGSNAFFDAQGNIKSMAEISGILDQALNGTREVMVEVGGRTAEQNAELGRLEKAYNRAQQSIRDYELGIKGVNLSDEARNKKLEEQRQIMANAGAQIEQLRGVRGDLVSTTQKLTAEERAMALETIFGADALGTAIALASEGEEGFLDLAEAMGATSAVDSAATRMDNLSGAFEIFQGVVETVQLQIGQAFLPLLQTLVERFTEMADRVGPQIVAVFERIAGGVQAFVDILTSGGTPLNAFFGALATAGVPNQTVVQIRNIVTAIKEFVDSITSFVAEHADALKGAIVGLGAVLAAAAIAATITGIVGALAALLNPVTLVVAAVGALGFAWQSNFLGIQDIVQNVVAFVQPIIMGFVERIRAIFMQNWPVIQAVVLTAWEVIQSAINAAVAVLQPAIEQFVSSASTALGRFDSILPALSQLWEALKPIITGVLIVLGGAIVAFLGVVVGMANGVANAIGPLIDTFRVVAHGIVTALTGVADFVTGFVNFFVGLFQGNSEKTQAAWRQMGEGIKGIVDGLVTAVVGAIVGLGVSLGELIKGLVEGTVEFFQNLSDELIGGSVITDMIDDILNAIVGLKDDFIGLIRDLVQDSIDTIAGRVSDFVTLGADIVAGIKQGILDSLGSVVSAAKNLVESAIDAAKEAAGITSPSTVMAAVGDDLIAGLINSVRDGAEEFSEVMQGIFDIGSAFGAIGNTVIRRFKQQVVDPLGDEIDQLEDELKSERGGLAEAMTNVFTSPIFGEDVDPAGRDLFRDLVAATMRARDARQALNQAVESGGPIGTLRNEVRVWDDLVERIRRVMGLQGDLNQARAEQAEAEERILRLQEKQQELQFLQQQAKLLELIQQHGLNAENVLGGLKLGLAANTGAVVDAMTRAMRQIIVQAEDELGISSPSSVFANIGRFIMAGLQEGVMDAAQSVQIGQPIMQAMAQPIVTAAPYVTVAQAVDNSRSVSFERHDAQGTPISDADELRFLLAGLR